MRFTVAVPVPSFEPSKPPTGILNTEVRSQKETVGLNRGMTGSKVTGLEKNPVRDARPTLASQGIDKNLAHQARTLGALSDEV
jgi:hypothetical protein